MSKHINTVSVGYAADPLPAAGNSPGRGLPQLARLPRLARVGRAGLLGAGEPPCRCDSGGATRPIGPL